MLELVLRDAETRERRVIGTLTWPKHLEHEARAFITDNLLAERCGDSRRAAALLKSGVLAAADRGKFLAERPMYLPEPPHALSFEVDLEDFVAEFATALAQLRVAPPQLELLFEWT